MINIFQSLSCPEHNLGDLNKLEIRFKVTRLVLRAWTRYLRKRGRETERTREGEKCFLDLIVSAFLAPGLPRPLRCRVQTIIFLFFAVSPPFSFFSTLPLPLSPPVLVRSSSCSASQRIQRSAFHLVLARPFKWNKSLLYSLTCRPCSNYSLFYLDSLLLFYFLSFFSLFTHFFCPSRMNDDILELLSEMITCASARMLQECRRGLRYHKLEKAVAKKSIF